MMRNRWLAGPSVVPAFVVPFTLVLASPPAFAQPGSATPAQTSGDLPALPAPAPEAEAPPQEAPAVTVAPPASEPPEPAPHPDDETSAAQPRAVAPDHSFADLRYQDANEDRVILGSTGETHPEGTFFISDYELVLLQLGYAFTDDFQMSVSLVPPFVKDQPYLMDLGFKINVVRTETSRIALTGALDFVSDGQSQDTPVFIGRVGGVAQFCFDTHCRSSTSFNLALGYTSSDQESFVPVLGTISVIAGISRLVSFLAEPSVLALHTNRNGDGGAVLGISYGFRIAGPRFGVDLTMVAPVAFTNGDTDTGSILGYPFVAFTYRTEGKVPLPPESSASRVGGYAGASRAAPESGPAHL
jgi:hypothetical protein